MADLQIWAQIPDGSELRMSLTAPEGKIVSGKVTGRKAGAPLDIPDAALRPEPMGVLLQAPHDYGFEVRVTFAHACTARFSARVVKPGNGGVHATPYDLEVVGGQGDVKLITIECITKKGAA